MINKELTPTNLFELFFDEEFIGKLVKETNTAAKIFVNEKLKIPRKPKDSYLMMNWYDTFPEEMKAFIACIILSGIYRLPEIKDHWGPHKLIKS